MTIVLARHGALAPFETLMADAGIAPLLLTLVRLFFGNRRNSKRPGERLALALTDLGPAFIKLGQVLSTRSDLLGEEAAADLAKLQDQLPPFSPFEARSIVEEGLGAPIDDLFSSFEDQPVSAASISQVHFAVTKPDKDHLQGQAVAVKVLRPGIELAFKRDTEFLLWIARWIERAHPRSRRLKPVEVVKTFAATMRVEMDLRLEAAAAAELRKNFTGDANYKIPEIDWQRTARCVMTQERLSGIRMDDRQAMLVAGFNIDDILRKAAEVFFHQVFRDGYFHGDQHPGNMSVGPDGAIQAMDFGIMGRLSRSTRYFLADMLLAFLKQDYARVARIYAEIGYLPADQSIDEFTLALRSIGEPIHGRPLQDVSFARVLGQIFNMAENFNMEVQPELLLLQKNMLMAEGISRQLNPSLNIWMLAQPMIERWMRENRGPEARIAQAADEILSTIRRIPVIVENLDRISAHLAEGGLKLDPEALNVIKIHNRPWGLWILIAALAAGLVFLR